MTAAASQLAGIAVLIAIARRQRPLTLPMPRLWVPGPADQADQAALLEAEIAGRR